MFFALTAHIKHQPFLPYGQRLLQDKDENRPALELFTEFTSDPWPHKDLKTMMTSMVCLNPAERGNMHVVDTLLNNITKVFQAQRYTINFISILTFSIFLFTYLFVFVININNIPNQKYKQNY